MYICIYIHIYIYVCMYMYMYMYMYVCIYIYIYKYTYVCAPVLLGLLPGPGGLLHLGRFLRLQPNIINIITINNIIIVYCTVKTI